MILPFFLRSIPLRIELYFAYKFRRRDRPRNQAIARKGAATKFRQRFEGLRT